MKRIALVFLALLSFGAAYSQTLWGGFLFNSHNTTKDSVAAFSAKNISDFIRPYKVYVANITQSGTDAPVAIVLENTLGVVPTWARSGLGQYTITATGVFTSDKTALPDSKVFIGGEDQDEVAMTVWRRTSADALLMRIVKPQALESNIEMNYGLQGFTVTIKVYN